MAIVLDRTILRLSGPDARGFLDNLVTNDLGRLDSAPCVYAGLLSPQGKVQADMIVWADGPADLILEADPVRGPELLRRLLMFKLRAAVEIADASAELCAEAALEAAEGFAPDPRLPALGGRRVRARTAADTPGDATALETRRIALGVPDLARDAGAEEVFALEALFEELHGVDFKKGCFVGQENVSRMKRRATTRKKFCPIAFEGDAPAFGEPISAGAAEIGAVRTSANGRALALVRLDRAREAQDKGETLMAAGRAVRLDPPDWLLLPETS